MGKLRYARNQGRGWTQGLEVQTKKNQHSKVGRESGSHGSNDLWPGPQRLGRSGQVEMTFPKKDGNPRMGKHGICMTNSKESLVAGIWRVKKNGVGKVN